MIPHGRHIYAKASDMAKATMCIYTMSDHVLPHCKCVLHCCADFPCINLPDQETNKSMKKKPSIRFHVYHIILQCIAHGRIPLNEKYMLHV